MVHSTKLEQLISENLKLQEEFKPIRLDWIEASQRNSRIDTPTRTARAKEFVRITKLIDESKQKIANEELRIKDFPDDPIIIIPEIILTLEEQRQQALDGKISLLENQISSMNRVIKIQSSIAGSRALEGVREAEAQRDNFVSQLLLLIDELPESLKVVYSKVNPNIIGTGTITRTIQDLRAQQKVPIRIDEEEEQKELPIKYHILTPAGEITDLLDNTVLKIRHYQSGALSFDDASQLESLGYAIADINSISFEGFIAQFKEPIALFSDPQTVINKKPITIFTDGSTSDVNSGIFNDREAENEKRQRIIDEMNDQLSIFKNQILDPNLIFNSSELTEEEVNFIKNNQDAVEQFQKTHSTNSRSTKSYVDDLIAWIRRLLN